MEDKLSNFLSLAATSIFLVILLTSFASAAVNFVNVAGNSQSVDAGSAVTISFQAQESGNGDLTNITFNTPITIASGSNIFNSASSVTNAITLLNQSATSTTMSLLFNVPSGQAAGTYTGNLTLSGEYVNSVSYDLPINNNCKCPNPSNQYK